MCKLKNYFREHGQTVTEIVRRLGLKDVNSVEEKRLQMQRDGNKLKPPVGVFAPSKNNERMVVQFSERA